MNSKLLGTYLLFCLFVIAHSQTCSWSSWGEWSTCSDTCGNCGSQARTRTCTTTDVSCSCSGSASEQQTCGPAVCLYPRASCCTGSPASVNARFECA